MSEISIDVGEIAAKEIAKRDRKIARLESGMEGLRQALNDKQKELDALDSVRKAVVEASYWIDPYR